MTSFSWLSAELQAGKTTSALAERSRRVDLPYRIDSAFAAHDERRGLPDNLSVPGYELK